MITAQQIIQEALEQACQFKSRDKMSLIEKLFDFSSPSDSQIKSSAIMYLTNRLMKEMEDSQKATRKAEYAIKRGLSIIEMYGTEATKLYLEGTRNF